MPKLNSFVHKFTYAWRGIAYVVRREPSFRFELVVTAVVLAAAWWWRFTPLGWALAILTIGVVLSAEVVNTVLERVLDLIEPRLSLHVRLLKDMLAGALLLLAVVAVVVGCLILRSAGVL